MVLLNRNLKFRFAGQNSPKKEQSMQSRKTTVEINYV